MGHTILGPLAFWEGFESELLTLGIYAVGLSVYALLVGTFYRTLSRRNLLEEKARSSLGAGFFLMFPVVSFGLFLVLAVALFFLAKEPPGTPVGTIDEQRVRDLLLLSMALVAGVRVAAYISEKSSEDLAKLVPLGLLGVLLVDPGFLSVNAPFQRLALLPFLADLVLRYFLATVALELLLRLAYVLTGGPKRARARLAKEAEAKKQGPAAPPKAG